MPARAPLSQIVTTGRSVGTSAPEIGEEPVGDVAAAGDVAAVALVALAHVDHLGALLEQPVELVEVDRLDPLGAAAEDVALELEEADRAEPAHRPLGLVALAAWTTTAVAGVEHEAGLGRERGARHGTLSAPWRVAGEVVDAGRTSSTVAPAGAAASSPTSAGRRRTGRG